MTFILNEDGALKTKLTGITVPDPVTTTRTVPVYYRFPENEARAAVYPFITLNLVNIAEDTERTHRGQIKLTDYIPDSNLVVDTSTNIPKVEFPTPYMLDYQITTWARYAQHDRYLLAKLLTFNYLPHHYGYLNVPQDVTVRRLDLLNIVNGDVVDANKKRLFRKIFNIRVSSELLVHQVAQVQKVLTVGLTIKNPSSQLGY